MKRKTVIWTLAAITLLVVSSKTKKPTADVSVPNTQVSQPKTPTSDPAAKVPDLKCPHPAQIPLTPFGQPDPVCVYKKGTNGERIRTELSEQYTQARKEFIAQGLSPAEVEQKLLEMDLHILKTITEYNSQGEI
jgi:hypothetical protein